MPHLIAPGTDKRGITVLGLVLLIIALVAAAVFLVQYLRSRPAAVSVVTAPSPVGYPINRLIS
jgi:hypothetical protein